MFSTFLKCSQMPVVFYYKVIHDLGRVRLGSIRNKNNWNNASMRLFGSYSHSVIPGLPFRVFCSQKQNTRNIFLFRNIPNERALSLLHLLYDIDFTRANNKTRFFYVLYSDKT